MTQTEVSDNFKMLVPLYLEMGGRLRRLGQAKLKGGGTTPEFEVVLPARPTSVLLNARNDVLARDVQSTLIE